VASFGSCVELCAPLAAGAAVCWARRGEVAPIRKTAPIARLKNSMEEEAFERDFDENRDCGKFNMTGGYSCFFCTPDDKA
jgi:hypothetical protein